MAATTLKPPSFYVEITGNGKPMILIPGLHLRGKYECHVLTLAGFAGEPRIEARFLLSVRRRALRWPWYRVA